MRSLLKKPQVKILLIACAHLCQDTYTSFIAPVLKLFIDKFALNYTEAALITTIMRLPMLLNPLIGAYAERINPKYILIATPAITATTMCLTGVAPNYPVLLFLIFIGGLSAAFFHVPTPSIAREVSKNNVGFAMSAFQMGGEACMILAPFTIVAAVSAWGLERIYFLIPFGFLMSLALYFGFRNFPDKVSASKHSIRGSIKETLFDNKSFFIGVFGAFLIRGLTIYPALMFLPTYVVESGKSLWAGAIAITIIQTAGIIGILVCGKLIEKYDSFKILLFCSVCAPAALILMMLSGGVMFTVFSVFMGFVGLANATIILTMIQKGGFKYPSVANGIYMMINFVLNAATLPFVGKISDFMGIRNALIISSAISFIGIPFMLPLGRFSKKLKSRVAIIAPSADSY